MNYSDFPDIQQDEWSLTRPTFSTPKEGTLTVVGWSGKSGNSNKGYVVECSECKKDKELFGGGVFKTFKGTLIRGSVSCGCSRSPRWSPAQYETLIKRFILGAGYEMLGFEEEKVRPRTKVRISCKKHGEWSTSCSSVLKGCRCVECGRESERRTHSRRLTSVPEDLVKNLPNSYSLELDRKQPRKHIRIKCSICAQDKYSKEGLCDGVFYSTPSRLREGRLPCRCQGVWKYTEEQLTYRANKACSDAGYKFTGWVDEPRSDNKIGYLCEEHGSQIIQLSNMLSGGGCPECAGRNQQQGYINSVQDGEVLVAIKFGIAKESKRRLKSQNSKNVFQMNQVAVFNFPSVKACKDAEKACKSELACGILSSRELKDGHTETTSLQNIERVIEIYKRFGGVRVKLPN